jgi:nitrogen-specific signal transduction histidine kinase/CheY-like chemotaxis protein
LAVVRDVTERKNLEEQLRQAQKMDAVGQLAGVVAHDFNNILAGFMLNLGLMEGEDGLSPQGRTSLKEMGEQAKLAAALTRRLLLFSRRQVMDTRPTNLIELLGELAEMLHRLLGEAHELRIDTDGRPLWIDADSGMIGQVVMNLCLNARDAMANGGPISIRLREAAVTDSDFPLQPQATAGRFACLEVIDTGCGMTDETLRRLFEPFFTTKDPGKGTGLGLAIAYGVVQQHRGWIKVQSAESKGSTFSVYLPVCEEPENKPIPAPKEPAAAGRENLLLTEDEPALRAVTKRVLERLGYRVSEAENGPAAQRIWDEKKGNFDLLLTDMGLPGGMTGLELAESLIAKKRSLKIIIASGYNTELVKQRPDRLMGAVYLAKPFQIDTLTRAVRQCLDAKKG